MTAFDLDESGIREAPERIYIKHAGTYLAAPVRLVWRRVQRESVIKMSTVVDKASPVVNTH